MASAFQGKTVDASLLHFFYDGLRETPLKSAVKFDSSDEILEISYSAVNTEANNISTQLAALFLENEIICLSSCPTISTLSIIIGILKIPAAFSFVDFNTWPMKYIWSFLQQLGSCYIFIQENEYETINTEDLIAKVVLKFPWKFCTLLLIKVENIERKKYSNSNWKLAYAIRTSGSTGIPKIIKVPHRCIVPNVIHMRDVYSVTSEDVIFVAAPLTFDPSVVDIFLAVSRGACVLLTPEALKSMPRKLSEILTVRNKATIIQVVPSFMRMHGPELLRETILGPNSSLRILGLGGEPCPPKSTLRTWKSPQSKVEIYNVYGITEVSSWATMHQIDFETENEEIPLGEPIMGTKIQVINSEGQTITVGEGQLYLGGDDRICFIGGEEYWDVCKCPMRASGDLVKLTADGQMFYVGRLDDEIIRHGKKISLSEIETVAKTLPEIENCHVLYNSEKEHILLIMMIKEDFRNKSTFVKEKLKNLLVKTFPQYYLPDHIMAVNSIPVTSHGKIDKNRLITLSYLQDELPKIDKLNYEQIYEKIQGMWKLHLGVNCDINPLNNFIMAGGNSLKVIYMSDEIQSWLGNNFPLLVEKLLNDNIHAVCLYLENTINNPIDAELYPKIAGTSNDNILPEIVDYSNSCAISRGNTLHYSVTEQTSRQTGKDVASPNFKIRWKYDTKKCIDASPLIIHLNEETIVFIGSHSHLFSAVALETGIKKWEFQAEGRIESSACASDNGDRVFVGSYDCNLYCLDVNSGTVIWQFKCGGLIKSSPAFDKVNKYVYFGSYDHKTYALHAEDGKPVWKTELGDGSVFSSPCICYYPHQIYIGTLGGTIGALHPESGNVLWKSHLKSPIFSSCTLVPQGVCFASVDHTVHCYDHNGNKVWNYQSAGPIFSSLSCALNSIAKPVITFGCHDNYVYCIDSQTSDLCWKVQLKSPVYSTPFVQCTKGRQTVYICSTNGILNALSLDTGQILSTFEFPGEIFSSPVGVVNRLLVGCRDNFLYCLNVI